MIIDLACFGVHESVLERQILLPQKCEFTHSMYDYGPRFMVEGYLTEGKGYNLMAHDFCHLCHAPLVEDERKKQLVFVGGEHCWKYFDRYTYGCGTVIEVDSEKKGDLLGDTVILGDKCIRLTK